MFYGHYTIHIREQQIISLPDRFSDDLGCNLFITQGFDRNLMVMPEQVFLDFYSRVRGMNMANPLARQFLRHFFANAAFVSNGDLENIEISDHLSEYAGLNLEEAAVMVGQGDHLEIWEQKKWREQSMEILDASKNAHRFAALDIRAG